MSVSLHHSFNIDFAEKYGIEEAIIIHHFQHWIRVNQRLNRHFLEDRTWTYQTREEIAAHFPYLSFDQVRRITEKLVEKKVIITKNFSKDKFSRTLWYAFRDEKEFLGKTEEKSNKSYESQICQIERPICQIEMTNLPNHIYSTDTKTNTDTKRERAPTPKKVFSFEKGLVQIEDYEKLQQRFGKALVDNYIDRLERYSRTSPQKFHSYASHDAVIEDWIIEDQAKDKVGVKTNSISTESKNRTVLEAFARRNKELLDKKIVKQTNDSVILDSKKGDTLILEFDEHGFADQVDSFLRKHNISFNKVPKQALELAISV